MPESEKNVTKDELRMAEKTETSSTSPIDLAFDDRDLFELIYEGPNVADGTMNAKELTEVLTGLTRAFSAIVHDRDFDDQYELRVKDIDAGSFHIIFEAIAFAKANPGSTAALAGAATVTWNVAKDAISGAYKVVTDIAKAIDAKKKIEGSAYKHHSYDIQ